MDILFILGRALFGGFFLVSSLNHFSKLDGFSAYAASKNVPAPRAAVIFSGLLIFFGGLGVMLGVYTEWTVVMLAAFLAPVSFKMHNFWAIADPNDKMMQTVNFTKNMALLGAALLLLFIPVPWPYRLW